MQLTDMGDMIDIAPSHAKAEGRSLVSYIKSSTVEQHGVYDKALKILDSMRATPSCQRMATVTLLDSCQSIDGNLPTSETILEDNRSVYAAQLALCEIESAGTPVPPPCSRIRSAGESKIPRPSRFDLSQCLHTLETKAQWWTSYSNNRQNAVLICQAARAETEKGTQSI